MNTDQDLYRVEEDRILIYPVKRLMLRRLGCGLSVALVPLTLITFVGLWFAPDGFVWVPFALLIALLAGSIISEWLRKAPLLVLSLGGLEICYAGLRFGPLPWPEVGRLRVTRNVFNHQRVEVPLYNGSRRVDRSHGILAPLWRFAVLLSRMTASGSSSLEKCALPVDCLPISPDEFIALTEQFRNSSFVFPAHRDGSIWPPPPKSTPRP